MTNIDFNKSPKILVDFYKYLINIQNYSSGTAQNYFSNIFIFLNFIKIHKHLDIAVKEFEIFVILGITERDILSYISYLSIELGNEAVTRNTKLFGIKTFFNYVFSEYHTYCKGKENPAANIKPAKKIKKEPKYLCIDEAKKIINIFNEYNSNYPIRNNLIILLILSLGLRLGELVSLNIDSIDFEKKTIKVLGKGKKERILYINSILENELNKYMEIRNKILTNETSLFLSERKTRISRRTVQVIVENAYILAGIDNKHYTVHTLRHTAATLIYKETKDILSVMQILGHSSIQTSQIYTHLENSDIKNALNSNPIYK